MITTVLVYRNAQTIGKKLVGIKVARNRRFARHLGADILAALLGQQPDHVGAVFRLLLFPHRQPHDLRRAAALLPRLHRRHHRHSGLIPAIDTVLSAETPEGIAISIRPAGFAVRATAFLIDAAIRVFFLMTCATVLAAGGRFGGGLFYIFLFVLNWLYPVIFELTPAAATPGKRIMGLVVLMANGLPITPAGCLIRNLMRVVDVLPLFYAFGIVCDVVAQRLSPARRPCGRDGGRLPLRRSAGRLTRGCRPHSSADPPIQAPANRHHGLWVSCGAAHPRTRRGDRRARFGRRGGHPGAPLAHRPPRGRCPLAAR